MLGQKTLAVDLLSTVDSQHILSQDFFQLLFPGV